jgi:hypothetical protein
MKVFRALVVDDDDWVLKKAKSAEDQAAGIEVLTASTKEQAAELIADNFLHLAVVDLELSKTPRDLGEGRMVLGALMRVRPSCRRILLTKHATTFPERVFEMLKPDDPVAHGAIDKDTLEGYFHRYVRSLADAWRCAPVAITNLDEIDAALSSKPVRGETFLQDWRAAVTRDELQFVLASLFGQRFRNPGEGPDPDDIEHIALEPFHAGKSRSIVLHGRPVNRLGGEGLLCVVKVGPRADAEQELTRYQRYIRFRMSLSRRVELLGSAIGDTLGAIAYSFAGQDLGDIGDLQTLLDQSDPQTFSQFDTLYAEHNDWGPDGEDGDDLGAFFHEAYGLRPRAVRGEISLFADDQASKHGWQHRRDELLLSGGKLVLPSDDDSLGMGLLHMDYRTTVVHGDLNGSNVIVGENGQSILIDYRDTTRGPRALDYASMHASIRLSLSCRERPVSKATDDEAAEYQLWQNDWTSGLESWRSSHGSEPPFWLAAAAHLMYLASNRLPDLSRAEHAATCWLYALRVFRVRQLEKEARLRIMIWMSALERILADERSNTAET